MVYCSQRDCFVVRVKEKITINLQTNVCSQNGSSGRYPSFLGGIIFITAWLRDYWHESPFKAHSYACYTCLLIMRRLDWILSNDSFYQKIKKESFFSLGSYLILGLLA